MALFAGNIYIDILVLLIILFLSLKVYFDRAFSFWKNKGIETLPPTFLFENAGDLFLQKSALSDVLKKYYNEMKVTGLRCCGFYFLAQPTLIVLDLDLLKRVMTKDFHHFTDRGIYYNEKIDPLSAHLLTLTGSTWKNIRHILSPTFSSGKMKMMFHTLLECSKQLVVTIDNVAKNYELLDVKEILGRFTTDVIGSCAFGIECNSLKDPYSEFRKYGKKALGMDLIGMLKNITALFAPKILETLQLPVINAEASKFFLNIVKETIAYREANSVSRKDFMHLLIQLKNNIEIGDEEHSEQLTSCNSNNDISLTEEQIAAEAFVFFVAGFETSATTLTFCFYELASNLDIQDKLREETIRVLAKHDGKLTYDALMEMVLLDKCVNETLRKHPPIPFVPRICTETYKIPDSDVVIEKGTSLFIPVVGIHNDPEYYPDPDRFDPERFSSENKSSRHNFAFIPFGEGPRICIGLRFGLMQIKVGLAVLLPKFKFTLNSKTQMPLVLDPLSVFPSVKTGIWLDVEKIQRNE